jgi:hypothetical protein
MKFTLSPLILLCIIASVICTIDITTYTSKNCSPDTAIAKSVDTSTPCPGSTNRKRNAIPDECTPLEDVSGIYYYWNSTWCKSSDAAEPTAGWQWFKAFPNGYYCNENVKYYRQEVFSENVNVTLVSNARSDFPAFPIVYGGLIFSCNDSVLSISTYYTSFVTNFSLQNGICSLTGNSNPTYMIQASCTGSNTSAAPKLTQHNLSVLLAVVTIVRQLPRVVGVLQMARRIEAFVFVL